MKTKEGPQSSRTESSGPLQTSNHYYVSKNSQGAQIIDDFSSVDLVHEDKVQDSQKLNIE